MANLFLVLTLLILVHHVTRDRPTFSSPKGAVEFETILDKTNVPKEAMKMEMKIGSPIGLGTSFEPKPPHPKMGLRSRKTPPKKTPTMKTPTTKTPMKKRVTRQPERYWQKY